MACGHTSPLEQQQQRGQCKDPHRFDPDGHSWVKYGHKLLSRTPIDDAVRSKDSRRCKKRKQSGEAARESLATSVEAEHFPGSRSSDSSGGSGGMSGGISGASVGSQPSIRRQYYACTSRDIYGCSARKVVDRALGRQSVPFPDTVHYEGQHNHGAQSLGSVVTPHSLRSAEARHCHAIGVQTSSTGAGTAVVPHKQLSREDDDGWMIAVPAGEWPEDDRSSGYYSTASKGQLVTPSSSGATGAAAAAESSLSEAESPSRSIPQPLGTSPHTEEEPVQGLQACRGGRTLFPSWASVSEEAPSSSAPVLEESPLGAASSLEAPEDSNVDFSAPSVSPRHLADCLLESSGCPAKRQRCDCDSLRSPPEMLAIHPGECQTTQGMSPLDVVGAEELSDTLLLSPVQRLRACFGRCGTEELMLGGQEAGCLGRCVEAWGDTEALSCSPSHMVALWDF